MSRSHSVLRLTSPIMGHNRINTTVHCSRRQTTAQRKPRQLCVYDCKMLLLKILVAGLLIYSGCANSCQVYPRSYLFQESSVTSNYLENSITNNCLASTSTNMVYCHHPSRLTNSIRGWGQYDSKNFYILRRDVTEILFLFPSSVTLSHIELHYYSDSSRGLPRLEIFADSQSGTHHATTVSAIVPQSDFPGLKTKRISMDVTTTKVLMYKLQAGYQFALSEVEFYSECSDNQLHSPSGTNTAGGEATGDGSSSTNGTTNESTADSDNQSGSTSTNGTAADDMGTTSNNGSTATNESDSYTGSSTWNNSSNATNGSLTDSDDYSGDDYYNSATFNDTTQSNVTTTYNETVADSAKSSSHTLQVDPYHGFFFLVVVQLVCAGIAGGQAAY